MARSCIRFTLVIFIFGCSSLDKSINQGAYEQIISKYKDNLDKNNPELNYMVGEAYRKSNRIKDALPYYAAAIKEGVSDEEAS